MSYEFHGEISVKDISEDPIKKAVDTVITEQEYDDESISLTEKVDYDHNYMYYYCDGLDQDTSDGYEYFFCSVTNKIAALYPDCSMYSHICGTEMSSGSEFVYTVQLNKRHVKVLSFDYTEGEMVSCPECDGGIVFWGELDFDTAYNCEECGRHFTADEMNEIISEYVAEYDIDEFYKAYNIN